VTLKEEEEDDVLVVESFLNPFNDNDDDDVLLTMLTLLSPFCVVFPPYDDMRDKRDALSALVGV